MHFKCINCESLPMRLNDVPESPDLPTEAELEQVIPAFYARVRQDSMIGPLFNAAIDDWDHHLARLVEFWSSVMLSSRRYKGNPMMAHLRHRTEMDPEMFGRWLQLWAEVTDAHLSAEAAAAMQEKAGMIAQSLQYGLFFRFSGNQEFA